MLQECHNHYLISSVEQNLFEQLDILFKNLGEFNLSKVNLFNIDQYQREGIPMCLCISE